MIKSRKAELTTQQIVMLVILITSFVIILIFLFVLNPGETTGKEVCHESVVLKGKSFISSGPLNCQTDYVCISGGGKCENFNPTETVDVDLSKSDAKNQVMKAIAEKMSDCWWMFGEGKINYVGAGASATNYCSLCSIISFDDKIKLLENVQYNDFYEELNKPKDSSQTYLKYLYNVGDVSGFKENFESQDIKGEDYLLNILDFNKEYVILTGMYKAGYFTYESDNMRAPWNFFETNSESFPVVLLEKDKKSYDLIDCEEFLTKA
ncbi:MAG: hypothetical protein ABIH59_00535 [archaeon]